MYSFHGKLFIKCGFIYKTISTIKTWMTFMAQVTGSEINWLQNWMPMSKDGRFQIVNFLKKGRTAIEMNVNTNGTLFRYHIKYLLGFALKHRLLDRSNAKVQCLISEGNKGIRLIRNLLCCQKQPQAWSDTKSPSAACVQPLCVCIIF